MMKTNNNGGVTITIDTPEPAVARHPSVLIKARELRRWLDDLPGADPVTMATQLHEQLALLARYPDPPNTLNNLLTAYENPVGKLLDACYELSQDGHWQLTNAQLSRLRRQVAATLYELANCHAVELNRRGAPIDAAACYQIGLLNAQGMLLEIRQQQRLTRSAWRQLVQAYVLAGQIAGTERPYPNGYARRFDPDSLSGLLLRTWALRVADPQRMDPATTSSLIPLLAAAGRLLVTSRDRFATTLPLALDGKHDPLTVARLRQPPGGGVHWVDIAHIAIEANTAPTLLPHERAALQRLADLLGEHIRRQPGSADSRRTPRQPRRAAYATSIGLDAVHKRLLELLGMAHDTTDIGAHIVASSHTPLAPTATTARRIWQQIDQSVYGAGFVGSTGGAPIPTIGEILLFENTENRDGPSGTGFAARLRRLIDCDDQRFEFGVEKIRARLLPVELPARAGSLVQGQPRALLAFTDQSGSLLLAPSGTFHPNLAIDLQGSRGHNYRVQLLTLSEAPGRMEIIRIRVDD